MSDFGGGFFRSVTSDVRSVLRQEIQDAQDQATSRLRTRVRGAGKGGALLGGAAVCGSAAAGTSVVLVLRVLEDFLPKRLAALVATVLFGAGAAALAAAGTAELKRSTGRHSAGAARS